MSLTIEKTPRLYSPKDNRTLKKRKTAHEERLETAKQCAMSSWKTLCISMSDANFEEFRNRYYTHFSDLRYLEKTRGVSARLLFKDDYLDQLRFQFQEEIAILGKSHKDEHLKNGTISRNFKTLLANNTIFNEVIGRTSKINGKRVHWELGPLRKHTLRSIFRKGQHLLISSDKPAIYQAENSHFVIYRDDGKKSRLLWVSRLLGSRDSECVNLIRDLGNRRISVLKRTLEPIHYFFLEEEARLIREINDLGIPGIVSKPWLLVHEQEKVCGFVTQLYMGDLADIPIHDETSLISPFHLVLQGIRQLHEVDVYHRDIKKENILFTYDNGQLKFALNDFGWSESLTEWRDRTANKYKDATEHTYLKQDFEILKKCSEDQQAAYLEKIDLYAFGLAMKKSVHPVNNVHLKAALDGMLEEDIDKRLTVGQALELLEKAKGDLCP